MYGRATNFVAVVDNVQEWLQRTIAKVDLLLMEVCRKFEAEKYRVVSTSRLLALACSCRLLGGGWKWVRGSAVALTELVKCLRRFIGRAVLSISITDDKDEEFMSRWGLVIIVMVLSLL